MVTYVGWAVVGCGETHNISEHNSNTTELRTIDLQRHYVCLALHDLQREYMHDVMIIEQQDIQHRITSKPCSSGPSAGTGTPHLNKH